MPLPHPLHTLVAAALGPQCPAAVRVIDRPDVPGALVVLDLDLPAFQGAGVAGAGLAIDRVRAALSSVVPSQFGPALAPCTWLVRSGGELVAWDADRAAWHGAGWPSALPGRRPWAVACWEAAVAAPTHAAPEAGSVARGRPARR